MLVKYLCMWLSSRAGEKQAGLRCVPADTASQGFSLSLAEQLAQMLSPGSVLLLSAHNDSMLRPLKRELALRSLA